MAMHYQAYRLTIKGIADCLVYFQGGNVVTTSLQHYRQTLKGWSMNRLKGWMQHCTVETTLTLFKEQNTPPQWIAQRWTLRMHGVEPSDTLHKETDDKGQGYYIPTNLYYNTGKKPVETKEAAPAPEPIPQKQPETTKPQQLSLF